MGRTIKELRELLDSKQITVKGLLDKCFQNIEQNQDRYNAFITLNTKEAYEQAEIAQELINAGKVKPLTGIPIAIKDNISTKDILTTCGSKMLENYIPTFDATVIKKLKENNAIIIGKTNLDEFAMGSTNKSSFFGKVSNPINVAYVSGGSSGGSAAAVSADFAPIALGSDTGGSLRKPASFCGITALKPTYGRVSRYGLVAFASSFDHIGIMGNSALDCGYVLNAISGKDINDATSVNCENVDFNNKIGEPLKGKKIGIIKELLEQEMDKEVKENFLRSVDIFKQLGCEIKELSLASYKEILSVYYILSSAEAFSALGRYDGIRFGHKSKQGDSYFDNIIASRNEGFGWEVKKRMLLGLYSLSNENYQDYYQKAKIYRQIISEQFQSLLNECDFVIQPTTPTVAYKADDTVGVNDIFTVITNIVRVPAITTPNGNNKLGLPTGLQIIAKQFAESELIGACDAFQHAQEEANNEI